MPHLPRPRRHHASGFTLIELLVTLIVVAEILVAVSILFDTNDRLTRVQTQVADMQQSLRIGQHDMLRLARMAGRGGFPARIDPQAAAPIAGLALEVRNNVGTGTPAVPRELAVGYAGSPRAVTGTDIVTVRGCFEAPLWQVDFINPGNFTPDLNGDGLRNDARIILANPSPAGFCQSLTALQDALQRPLLIVSPADTAIFAVARITAVTPNGDLAADCLASTSSATVDLDFVASPGADYSVFTGGVYPPMLQAAAWACLLEEHRFYVREEWAVPGDATTELAPRLARAWMDPGQERPFGGDAANLRLDLADNIMDLQAALGFDADHQGAFDDDTNFVDADDTVSEGTDDASRGTDDWLYNSTADDPEEDAWRCHGACPSVRRVNLEYLRLTTIARTDRQDPAYQAPLLTAIEDRDFSVVPVGSVNFNAREQRMYRRRIMSTTVDMRNL